MKEQFKKLQCEFMTDTFLKRLQNMTKIRNAKRNSKNVSVTDVDNVLQRMTIIGVILCFRQLAQEALVDVLEERIPFLLTSILDFCQHMPAGESAVSFRKRKSIRAYSN